MFPAASRALRQDKRMRLLPALLRRMTPLIVCGSFFVLLASLAFSQQPPSPAPVSALEFPVFLLQNVTAGKTRPGTKIDSRLTIATLAHRVVVPEGAILSGQIVESVAKSATSPSRLSIRIDSARWRDGNLDIKLYLTAWYYPVTVSTRDAGSDPPFPEGSFSRRRRGGGGGTLPTSGADKPDAAPAASVAENRMQMKDVEIARNQAGAPTLTSSRANLKLDKGTVYVLAPDGRNP